MTHAPSGRDRCAVERMYHEQGVKLQELSASNRKFNKTILMPVGVCMNWNSYYAAAVMCKPSRNPSAQFCFHRTSSDDRRCSNAPSICYPMHEGATLLRIYTVSFGPDFDSSCQQPSEFRPPPPAPMMTTTPHTAAAAALQRSVRSFVY